MSQEPEQIEDLVFVPNPDYPYPFPVPQPPHFWMTEQSGALAEAVECYMNGEKIPPASLRLLRIYLRQYIERAVIATDSDRIAFLRRIDKLRTAREIENFADELSEVGIEPF